MVFGYLIIQSEGVICLSDFEFSGGEFLEDIVIEVCEEDVCGVDDVFFIAVTED